MNVSRMIERLVHDIYCLTPKKLALCCFLAVVAYCFLCRKYAGRRWLRPCLGGLLALWLSAVLWITVFSRSAGNTESHWLPLSTYWRVLSGESRELLRSAFMNAVLFFPAGLLLGGLLPGHRSFRWQLVCTVICFGLISLGIELTQFFNRLGNAEFDDVLHNTLGAAAGLAAFRVKWSDSPQT